MKNKFILLLVFFLQFNLYGQNQLLSSAGNFDSNGEIQLSWSLGEPIISTFSTNELILTQGFHQTRLNLTSTITPEFLADITIFPNPTRNYIYVDFGKNNNLPSNFYIYNLNGKLVMKGYIKSNYERIEISNLSNEMYNISFKYANHMLLSNQKFNKIN